MDYIGGSGVDRLVIGSFVAVFIGKEAASTMVGGLAADVLRGVFKVMILPIKGLKRLLGRNESNE